jgi:YHS domain-containing protein
MTNRFRLFPSALALSLAIGCAGEEGAAPASAPSPGPAPAPAPSAAPKAAEPPKEAAPAPKEEAKDQAPAPTPAADEKKAEDKKAEEKPSLEAPKADAGAAKLSDEELANVKKLPAGEQDAAIAQAVCPVSDEHLGAMDTPIKVTAEGRTFYLCCESCNGEVKSDPKAVIAKLDKLAKK